MKNLRFYRDIHDINVYIFYKILDTGNYNFLVKKYNENSSFKLEGNQLDIAVDLFDNIVNNFSSLNADKKTIKKLKDKATITYLESKYKVTLKCLELYEEYKDSNLLLILKDLDWKVDVNEDIDEQVSTILIKMKSLKMDIKIKKINYTNTFKEKAETIKKESFLNDLSKRSLIIEQALDLKYEINPMKTKLSKWCELIKLTNKKSISNG